MDKLEGIKPGDRVRVTFEGVVGESDLALNFHVGVDGGHPVKTLFDVEDIKSPRFHIERIEKPLAVGDRVKSWIFGGGVVLSTKKSVAFVEWDQGSPSAVYFDHLERLS